VASFCSNCGTQISPGAQACTACGAAVAAPVPVAGPVAAPPPAAAPVFVPVAVPVAAPAPMAAAPVPVKQGTSAVKVILIILAIFVGLGVLGAGAFGFFVWRVAHAVKVAANNGQVALNLPGGTFSANTTDSFSSSDLGTDIYPGASAGKGSMRMTLPTGTMVSAVYVTSDSKDQVVAYYKNKFGSDNVSSFDSTDGSVITYTKSQQEQVVVTVTSSPTEYDGKTQIHIVHTKATKAS
jgi:zinc-ribbon domain